MGGEGSMMAAIKSLSNNRNLLKRKGKSPLGGSYANIKLKDLPKATPEQLLEIKKRLERENREARIKNISIFLIMFFGALAFILFITQ